MKSVIQLKFVFLVLITTLGWLPNAFGQQGPAFQWALSQSDSIYPRGVAVDKEFNVYTAGIYSGTVDFDPGSGIISKTSNGLYDIYIQKFDNSGNLLWVKTIGGIYKQGCNRLSLDSEGNIYLSGEFYYTVDFNPGTGVFNLTSGQLGAWNGYILKLDKNGGFIWAKQIHGRDNRITDIVLDSNNNIYAIGEYTSTNDFDPGVGVVTLNGPGGTFVEKLDSNGNYKWVKHTYGYFNIWYSKIGLDQDGNIISSGIFSGTLDINPGIGTVNLVSNGNYDVFVQKLDSTGNFLWGKSFGGINDESVIGVTTDTHNNIYLIGLFSDTVDFNPGLGTYNLTAAYNDSYLLKLNGSGSFKWVLNLSPDSNAASVGNDVSFTNNHLYYIGLYNNGFAKSHIKKLDTLSNVVWTDTIGLALGSRLYVDPAENIYSVGKYLGTTDFDPGTGVENLYGPGSFLFKLGDGTATIGFDTVTACNSYRWANGVRYDTSIIITDTLVSSRGSDSVMTLNLTILPGAFSTDTYVKCDSLTWIDGFTYTESNTSATFVYSGAQANGCDSVVSLNLTINRYDSIDVVSTCGSYTWIDNVTYTQSNTTASVTNTNALGCDSVIHLQLYIQDTLPTIDYVTACSSYTWRNGVTYTSNNTTAKDTVLNSAGCDSILQLNLTIELPTSSTDTVVSCGAYTWINGLIYSSNATTPWVQFTGANGCDSIVTLNLTVHQITYGIDTVIACDSVTWTNGITYYNSTNFAYDTLIGGSFYGCDSITILNFTKTADEATDVVTACDSYTWIDGVTYTASNTTASLTFTNAAGCDSTIYLDLTLGYTTTATDTLEACDSYTWINGVTYTTSNFTAKDTLLNSSNCDSIVTLNLTLNNSSNTTLPVTACGSYAWVNTGISYYSSGMYYDTLVNGAGCDSIVTLDLTIHPIYSVVDTQTGCDNFTWTDGVTYTTSNNTATQYLTSVNGCDSVVTLDLTMGSTYAITDYQRICGSSFTWVDGVTYTATNTTATHTFTTVNGCDSVLSLKLQLTNIDTSVVRQGFDLTANYKDAVYQWLDCGSNYTPITGDTNRKLTVTKSGNYAVEITQNNCVDTSSCFAYINVGVNEVHINTDISVYPNPTDNYVTIDLQKVNATKAKISVVDFNGKTVHQKQITKNTTPWTTQVDLSKLATGVYFVKVEINGDEYVYQVSKL
tara:strand:- start:45152 stop:48703 length:3552 start_codon:yes stop_codon:yes gene_type:complete